LLCMSHMLVVLLPTRLSAVSEQLCKHAAVAAAAAVLWSLRHKAAPGSVLLQP
jgi:hypothetical protein